jgi:MFS family permease
MLSMIFFLLFLIPCAAAQNIQTMLVGRFFNGLAGSAFLSVAAGTVADLFVPSEIQNPMTLYTIAPFIGPALGPVIGGFINSFASWLVLALPQLTILIKFRRWSFYVLLIWTSVLLVCFIFTPETHEPTLLHRKALALRKSTGNESYKSTSEIVRASKSLSNALIHSLYRPFQLLALELMCLFLCLYSAVLLGILYLFFGAFPLIFRTNHDFNLWQTGLTFVGLGLGMILAVFTSPIWHKNYDRLVRKAEIRCKNDGSEKPVKPEPEFRLPPAIFGAVVVSGSMFWFGWTTYRSVHWIVPMVASVFFGGG